MSAADTHTRLAVKVVPGASNSEIAGWLGDELKLRIAAAPEKGKANRAVAILLCKTLGIPPSAVRILHGHASAHKVLEIDGLSDEEVRDRLGA